MLILILIGGAALAVVLWASCSVSGSLAEEEEAGDNK